MRRPTILASALLLGATTALVPSPASAAPGDFGHTCVAGLANPNVLIVMTAGAPTNPHPAVAPATGVVTKVTFNMPSISGTFPQQIKILRTTPTPNQYTVTAESAPVPVVFGTPTYDVRLPVAAGDLLGLYGVTTVTLLCSTGNAADTVGYLIGNVAPGSSGTFTPVASAAIPVVATVEPDADQDGFGDLTQDQCPQSASHHDACPVVVLDSFAASQGGSIVVVVGTDNQAEVKVTGTAKVNGTKIKLTSRSKTVTPGSLGKFTLKLPKSLRNALAALPPRKFIKVKLVATSTDLAGRTAKDKTSVKVYGTR